MDKYKVKLTPRAYRDLEEIYYYIALEKSSPEKAKNQTERIKKALKKLDIMPQSHQDRQSGQYASQGYKQLLIDNYITIFRIDEEQKLILVVTIQYQGRKL